MPQPTYTWTIWDTKYSPNSNGSKPHGTSLPGQQRKRDYHWPIDPNDANGRCTSKGVSEARRFGCPSIRTDIPKYERHSVADTQNYGDDVNAEYLLRPTQCASFGIDTEEFHKPRTKEYIQTLFQECGYDPMCEDDFDAIWETNSDKIGFMTISQFQYLYNTWFMKQMKSVGN